MTPQADERIVMHMKPVYERGTRVLVPIGLSGVSFGRLPANMEIPDGAKAYHWGVREKSRRLCLLPGPDPVDFADRLFGDLSDVVLGGQT